MLGDQGFRCKHKNVVKLSTSVDEDALLRYSKRHEPNLNQEKYDNTYFNFSKNKNVSQQRFALTQRGSHHSARIFRKKKNTHNCKLAVIKKQVSTFTSEALVVAALVAAMS